MPVKILPMTYPPPPRDPVTRLLEICPSRHVAVLTEAIDRLPQPPFSVLGSPQPTYTEQDAINLVAKLKENGVDLRDELHLALTTPHEAPSSQSGRDMIGLRPSFPVRARPDW